MLRSDDGLATINGWSYAEGLIRYWVFHLFFSDGQLLEMIDLVCMILTGPVIIVKFIQICMYKQRERKKKK